MSNMPVWTCTYAGSHGVDVSVYETEDEAVYGAIMTMLSMMQKVTNPMTKGEIFRMVENAEYDAAIRIYSFVANESFEINSKAVISVNEKTVLHALQHAKRECS